MGPTDIECVQGRIWCYAPGYMYQKLLKKMLKKGHVGWSGLTKLSNREVPARDREQLRLTSQPDEKISNRCVECSSPHTPTCQDVQGRTHSQKFTLTWQGSDMILQTWKYFIWSTGVSWRPLLTGIIRTVYKLLPVSQIWQKGDKYFGDLPKSILWKKHPLTKSTWQVIHKFEAALWLPYYMDIC